jgi:hypothetical protein
MVKRLALFVGLSSLLSLAFVTDAHASNHFSFQFGVTTAPRYVWQDGYYVRTPYGDRWVPGAWVPARSGRRDWDDEPWEREHREFHRDLPRG